MGPSRFRLAHFRDGWGVACGLDVNAVLGSPMWLSVTPGYALDAFGNDLVLAADTKVILCTASDSLALPCPIPIRPSRRTATARPRRHPKTFTAGPWEFPTLDNVRVFDLLLRYEPIPSDPVAALADKGAPILRELADPGNGQALFCPPHLGRPRPHRHGIGRPADRLGHAASRWCSENSLMSANCSPLRPASSPARMFRSRSG